MSGSLEFNKIAAGVLAAGVVAMLSGFIAKQLIHPERLEEPAYQTAGMAEGATGSEHGGSTAAADVLEPVLPLLAAADPVKGQAVAKACATCHSFEEGGATKVGPNLYNIVGASHAHVEGFGYSDAMAALKGTAWDYEALNHFLANPKKAIPGTKMTYAGLKKVQDRADLIAYLRSLSASPAPLPTQEEIDAAVKAYEEALGGGASEATEASATTETTGETATTEATGTQTAETGGDLPSLLAAASPENGEKLAKQCATCHSFDKGGPNKVGPNLWGVVGGPAAHLDGYNYSGAMKDAAAAGWTWTFDNLDAYLENPKTAMPGNKMTYAGMKKAEDRADLIAWLRLQADSPVPLP